MIHVMGVDSVVMSALQSIRGSCAWNLAKIGTCVEDVFVNGSEFVLLFGFSGIFPLLNMTSEKSPIYFHDGPLT